MTQEQKDKRIHFWGVYTRLSNKLSWLGFGLSIAAFLCFYILYGQGLLRDTYFIVMIICASLAGVFPSRIRCKRCGILALAFHPQFL